MPSSPRSATTSVAPNSTPRSVRVVWRPMRMIRSAPSRLADSTAIRPTAPSPITVAVVRSLTPAATATWCPVPSTSDSVSSDGSSAEFSPTGSGTRVPWAWGTRMASAWPPPTPFPPQKPPWRQDVCSPSRQKSQMLSAQANGATTRSPTLSPDTSDPSPSTTPMNSRPHRRALGAGRHAVARMHRPPRPAAELPTGRRARIALSGAGLGPGGSGASRPATRRGRGRRGGTPSDSSAEAPAARPTPSQREAPRDLPRRADEASPVRESHGQRGYAVTSTS